MTRVYLTIKALLLGEHPPQDVARLKRELVAAIENVAALHDVRLHYESLDPNMEPGPPDEETRWALVGISKDTQRSLQGQAGRSIAEALRVLDEQEKAKYPSARVGT